jgi:hypothetical protein
MWPIKRSGGDYNLNSSEFQSWLDGTQIVDNTEASLAWFEKNRESVIAKHTDYWPVWQEKSGEALAERTLSPENGE